MNLEEARRIVKDQDASDLARSVEAAAVVLRFYGIGDKGLLPIADALVSVFASGPQSAPAAQQAPQDEACMKN